MATELDRQKGETVHFYPQVLPGSQAVLFTASTGSPVAGNRDNIDVLSFKTGERKTLVRGSRLGRYLPSGHLVYLHQNTLLAAAFDLGKLAVTGAPQAVLEDVSYTRRGRWFTSAGNADIWVQDIERDTAVRLTSLPGANGAPLWTPDGKYIVFLSANQPSAGIYRTRADGSGEPQRLAEAVEGANAVFPSSVSPDGKRLALSTTGRRGFAADISTAPIEGDPGHPRLGKSEPFLHTPGFASLPTFALPEFSPDGRWLAFALGETGRSEV